jgi:hypothetical protein
VLGIGVINGGRKSHDLTLSGLVRHKQTCLPTKVILDDDKVPEPRNTTYSRSMTRGSNVYVLEGILRVQDSCLVVGAIRQEGMAIRAHVPPPPQIYAAVHII